MIGQALKGTFSEKELHVNDEGVTMRYVPVFCDFIDMQKNRVWILCLRRVQAIETIEDKNYREYYLVLRICKLAREVVRCYEVLSRPSSVPYIKTQIPEIIGLEGLHQESVEQERPKPDVQA